MVPPAEPPPHASLQTIGAGRVMQVNARDVMAAHNVRSFTYHIFPTSSHWGQPVKNDATKVFHPADLKNYGGSLMKSAVEHNIYVNCKSSDEKCWGKPEEFLTNLTGSKLIQLLNQYTRPKANVYTFGEGTPVHYSAYSKIYYDNDLFAILHAVAKSIGRTGYSNEYHIFLPKGVDNCFDGTTICYSPDNPANWYFCAYHGQVTFSDLGAVVFSVEPYQNVRGCTYKLPKGYDQLINSTDSTLAHETFESITDPNPNFYSTLGWYNIPYNQEVADLCDAFPMKQTIGSLKLYVQTMYSNKYHGCANGK
ncbi:MAG TPA: hypothetical protein VFE36_03810 [Candidatus Baltobacteraceae bacterium]|nr:hypothetical protein [Candidatus Baltobacteraceae bacterium]